MDKGYSDALIKESENNKLLSSLLEIMLSLKDVRDLSDPQKNIVEGFFSRRDQSGVEFYYLVSSEDLLIVLEINSAKGEYLTHAVPKQSILRASLLPAPNGMACVIEVKGYKKTSVTTSSTDSGPTIQETVSTHFRIESSGDKYNTFIDFTKSVMLFLAT